MRASIHALSVVALVSGSCTILGPPPDPCTQPDTVCVHVDVPPSLTKVARFPVQVGVPLAQGALPAGAHGNVVLRDPNGGIVPVQTKALTYWEKQGTPGRSIRYLQSAFSADLTFPVPYLIEYNVPPQGTASPSVTATRAGGVVTVDTGVLKLEIREANPTFID